LFKITHALRAPRSNPKLKPGGESQLNKWPLASYEKSGFLETGADPATGVSIICEIVVDHPELLAQRSIVG